MNLIIQDIVAAVRAVGVTQPIEAAVDLKRLLDPAGDDREIVCGIASPRVLPVDHVMRSVDREQDVLPA